MLGKTATNLHFYLEVFVNSFILFFILFPFFLYAEDQPYTLHELTVWGKNTNNLLDFVPAVSTLKGKNFTQKKQTSLGDTLQNELGVSSTGFGPNASRPVIRGLDGDRIKVLQNGLGTIDASSQSVDHAISADTLTMDQIEIVRGPMTLLYGSSAVGGIVNLVTNRIHSSFHQGSETQLLSQYESVTHGLSNSFKFDFGVKNWMFHVDGSTRNLQNMNTPIGELKNSTNRQDSLGFGVSRIFERGYLGLSYNHFNTFYGVVAEEEVKIKMKQNRFDLQTEWRLDDAIFSKVKFKTAQSSYDHNELEGNIVGTVFTNKGNETRLEALNEGKNIKGVTGLQTQIFHFAALGDEAFLPEIKNQQVALFSYQELHYSQNAFRLATRLEDTDIQKVNGSKKSFTSLSGSLGHQYDFDSNHSLTTGFSYNERTPNFQELYASGPHLATGTYEQGSESLTKEKSYALEMSYKANSKRNDFIFNVYTQKFRDYIALNPSGTLDTVSGLPLFYYGQVNALFYGFELENKLRLINIGNGRLSLKNTFDFVRAKDTHNDVNLPRISPPRLGATLEFSQGKSVADIGATYVFKQTVLAPNETQTAAYFLTNFNYSFKLNSTFSFYARVRNIFDVEARNHVSTLKDIAPLPGRNFIAGLQIQL